MATPRMTTWAGAAGAALALYAGVLGVNRALRRVAGPSMEPTLHAGELVLTVPARPTTGAIAVWQVGGGWRVKRVAAVGPAEVATDEDGRSRTMAVATGEVFLVGDNPGASTDSRHLGPVPAAAVTRRAVAVVWPRPRLLR